MDRRTFLKGALATALAYGLPVEVDAGVPLTDENLTNYTNEDGIITKFWYVNENIYRSKNPKDAENVLDVAEKLYYFLLNTTKQNGDLHFEGKNADDIQKKMKEILEPIEKYLIYPYQCIDSQYIDSPKYRNGEEGKQIEKNSGFIYTNKRKGLKITISRFEVSKYLEKMASANNKEFEKEEFLRTLLSFSINNGLKTEKITLGPVYIVDDNNRSSRHVLNIFMKYVVKDDYGVKAKKWPDSCEPFDKIPKILKSVKSRLRE